MAVADEYDAARNWAEVTAGRKLRTGDSRLGRNAPPDRRQRLPKRIRQDSHARRVLGIAAFASCRALFHSRPGNEPPPHVLEREHELYYLLEGRMEFYCDDEILRIGAGEVAFLPQGKAHAFYIRSPIVRALIFVQATDERAVGLDSAYSR